MNKQERIQEIDEEIEFLVAKYRPLIHAEMDIMKQKDSKISIFTGEFMELAHDFNKLYLELLEERNELTKGE